jgi:hypothetical protein
MRLLYHSKHDPKLPEEGGVGKPSILIVDADLGFTFWLGQALDAIGCTALPANAIAPAQELVRAHRLRVDVLVIDPFVLDAFLFVAYLRKTQPGLQVVAAIPEEWEKSWPPIPEFDAAIRKPRHFTAAARMEWVDLIRGLQAAATGGQPGPAQGPVQE